MLSPLSSSAPPTSLVGQALLFSPDIELRIDEEESRGIYTAERALVKRPGLRDAVIKLRAEGEGLLSIAGKLNCHHRTVSAIATLFAENVDIERAKRVSRLRSAADKLVELIDNEPNSVPANVRALAASQLYDKAELLDGRATQRIERTERVDIYATWQETVEKLLDPESVVEIEAQVPGIGLGDGNVLPIGAPAADLADPGDAAGSDEESLDSQPSSKVERETDTSSETDSESSMDSGGRADHSLNQAGGGGRDRRGGAT